MKDGTGHTVTTFSSVELGENAPSIVLVINVGQHVRVRGMRPKAPIARASVDGCLLLRIDRISSDALTFLAVETRRPATSHPSCA